MKGKFKERGQALLTKEQGYRLTSMPLERKAEGWSMDGNALGNRSCPLLVSPGHLAMLPSYLMGATAPWCFPVPGGKGWGCLCDICPWGAGVGAAKDLLLGDRVVYRSGEGMGLRQRRTRKGEFVGKR